MLKYNSKKLLFQLKLKCWKEEGGSPGSPLLKLGGLKIVFVEERMQSRSAYADFRRSPANIPTISL